MKLIQSFVTVFLLSTSFVSLAMADDSLSPMENPYYVGGSLGIATDFQKRPEAWKNNAGFSFDQYRFAANADIGRMFNDNVGVELGFGYWPGTKVGVPGAGYETINRVVDLAVKGVLPLGKSGFDLFAKLGPAFVVTSGNFYLLTTHVPAYFASTFALYGATGISYNVNDQLSIDLQVAGVSNTNTNPDPVGPIEEGLFKKNPPLMYTGLGVTFRFGS